MSFNDIINYSKAIHSGIKLGIEKEERRRAARATRSFIISTIITTIISIALSLFLPLWVVCILLLIYGLVRFIYAMSDIEFSFTVRKLLKSLGLWDKSNDMIIVCNIIWGGIIFVLIKVIRILIVL